MPTEVLAISWSSGRDGGNISPPWQGRPAQTPVQLLTNSLPLCSLLLGQAEPNREAEAKCRGQVVSWGCSVPRGVRVTPLMVQHGSQGPGSSQGWRSTQGSAGSEDSSEPAPMGGLWCFLRRGGGFVEEFPLLLSVCLTKMGPAHAGASFFMWVPAKV